MSNTPLARGTLLALLIALPFQIFLFFSFNTLAVIAVWLACALPWVIAAKIRTRHQINRAAPKRVSPELTVPEIKLASSAQ